LLTPALRQLAEVVVLVVLEAQVVVEEAPMAAPAHLEMEVEVVRDRVEEVEVLEGLVLQANAMQFAKSMGLALSLLQPTPQRFLQLVLSR
jgi:hypothetical protein